MKIVSLFREQPKILEDLAVTKPSHTADGIMLRETRNAYRLRKVV